MKNKKIKLLSCIVSFMTIFEFIPIKIANAADKPSISAIAQGNSNYIQLNWTPPNAAEKYTYMIYSKSEKENFFQTIPAKSKVKVLNIYPDVGNNLKTWMENEDKGKGLMTVDAVSISDFNNNPSYYLGTIGNWNYDTIMIGSWDSNNNRDLNITATNLIKSFIESGRGILLGHDTINRPDYEPNLNTLQSYLNMNGGGSWDMSTSENGISKIKIKKKGLLTNYPWNIGEIGTVLTVPGCHDLGQIANGDIWMDFAILPEGQSNFYLTTWNNAAMVQTGHTGGQATEDEQKLLANTLFYLAQVTDETSWGDHKGQDLENPDTPTLQKEDINNGILNISYSSTDKGTNYEYYVESTGETSHKKTMSDVVSTTEISGIDGYSYVVDNNEGTIPNDDIDTSDTNISINLAKYNTEKPLYLHIKSIDNAKNSSETMHYKYEDSIKPTATHSVTATDWTNGTVDINITANDNSGIRRIKLPNGTYVNGNLAKYTVKENGNYKFYIEDYFGNILEYQVDTNNIDKTSPTIKTDYDKNWTSDEVTVSVSSIDNQSGVKSIILPDGKEVNGSDATFKTSQNGKLIFKSIDNAGNESIKEVDVNNIDKTKPNSVKVDSNGDINFDKWFSNPIKLNVSSDGTNGNSGIKEIQYQIRDRKTNKILKDWDKYLSGITEINIEGDLAIDFKVISNSEMESEISTIYVKIDKTAPIATITSNETSDWSKEPINVSVHAEDKLSGIKSIKLPNGNIVNSNNINYQISDNGTNEFEITDNANNIIKKTITITNVDNSAPEISIKKVGDEKGYINKNLELEVNANDSQSGVKSIILPDGTIVEGDYAKYSITKNDKYVFKCIDNVGNVTKKIVNIGPNGDFDIIIDKSAPKLEITPSTKEWTNKDIILSVKAIDNSSGFAKMRLPDGTWTTSNDVSYTLNTNGQYSFVTVDNLGNEETTYYKVNNIDRKLPLATIEENITDWTTNNVIMNVSALDSESGIKRIQLPNGTWVNKNEVSYETNHNGIYSYVIEDVAGNQQTYTFNVTNIDKEKPSEPSIKCDSGWTNSEGVNVTVDLLKNTPSGTKNVLYRLSGATSTGWLLYTNSLFIKNEGITKIEAKIINNVDVESDIVSKEVMIDREVPLNNDIIIHKK